MIKIVPVTDVAEREYNINIMASPRMLILCSRSATSVGFPLANNALHLSWSFILTRFYIPNQILNGIYNFMHKPFHLGEH